MYAYYIFEVSFPQEAAWTDSATGLPQQSTTTITARAIYKYDVSKSDGTATSLIDSFKKAANTKPGDHIELCGMILERSVVATLDLWMKNRTVLDPVGLLSDD